MIYLIRDGSNVIILFYKLAQLVVGASRDQVILGSNPTDILASTQNDKTLHKIHLDDTLC